MQFALRSFHLSEGLHEGRIILLAIGDNPLAKHIRYCLRLRFYVAAWIER